MKPENDCLGTSVVGGPVKIHVAKQICRRLWGGSASLLISDTDHKQWIVKFRDNPQHHRVPINEYLATRMASAIGLTVPECGLIDVDETLTDKMRAIRRLDGTPIYAPGIHFGSASAPGCQFRKVLTTLPATEWHRVVNVKEFAGALAFDVWVNHTDRRQAVFTPYARRSRRLTAFFIDNGHCFGDLTWHLDHSTRSYSVINPAYLGLKDWSDFEPWLSAIENFSAEKLHGFISEMPEAWLIWEHDDLDALVNSLLRRKHRVRSLLMDSIYARKAIFPAWPSPLRSIIGAPRADSATGSGCPNEKADAQSVPRTIDSDGCGVCLSGRIKSSGVPCSALIQSVSTLVSINASDLTSSR